MKVIITITVRMKSTRLPKKALLPIKDKTMLEHLIERLKLMKRADSIVLCTSTNPQDDVLIEYAKKAGIKWFRGSEDDVLERLYGAAKQEGADFICSTTGDNPFTDPEVMEWVVELAEKEDADFVNVKDIPFGAHSYGIKVKALERVMEIKADKDTEIWGVYFTESGEFNCKTLEIKEELLRRQDIRLSVDTEEDYEFVKTIFERLYDGSVIPLRKVIELVNKEPELLEINKNVVQKAAPKPNFKE